MDSLVEELSLRLELEVLVTVESGESPLLGLEDLHATRELEGSTTDGLAGVVSEGILGTD